MVDVLDVDVDYAIDIDVDDNFDIGVAYDVNIDNGDDWMTDDDLDCRHQIQ